MMSLLWLALGAVDPARHRWRKKGVVPRDLCNLLNIYHGRTSGRSFLGQAANNGDVWAIERFRSDHEPGGAAVSEMYCRAVARGHVHVLEHLWNNYDRVLTGSPARLGLIAVLTNQVASLKWLLDHLNDFDRHWLINHAVGQCKLATFLALERNVRRRAETERCLLRAAANRRTGRIAYVLGIRSAVSASFIITNADTGYVKRHPDLATDMLVRTFPTMSHRAAILTRFLNQVTGTVHAEKVVARLLEAHSHLRRNVIRSLVTSRVPFHTVMAFWSGDTDVDDDDGLMPLLLNRPDRLLACAWFGQTETFRRLYTDPDLVNDPTVELSTFVLACERPASVGIVMHLLEHGVHPLMTVANARLLASKSGNDALLSILVHGDV